MSKQKPMIFFNKILSFIFIVVSCTHKMHAQKDSVKADYHYLSDDIRIHFWDNPAYTGVESRPTLRINYQRQWLSIEDGPRNMIIGYDNAWGKKKIFSTGFYTLADRAGNTTLNTYALSAGVKFKIKDVIKVGAGLAILLNQSELKDWNSLTFGDMIDSWKGFIFNSFESNPDYSTKNAALSAGLCLSIKKFHSGISISNIASNSQNANKSANPIIDPHIPTPLPKTYLFNAVYYINIDDNFLIVPSFILKKYGTQFQISPFVDATYKNTYLLGMGSRNLNSLEVRGGILLFKHLKISLAAATPIDMNLAEISRISCIEGNIRYQF